MPLLKKIYTRRDGAGEISWTLWDGQSLYYRQMFAVGELFVVVEHRRGNWWLEYRLGTKGLDLPEFVRCKTSCIDDLKPRIHMFADWAVRNQLKAIRAHEMSID